MTQSDQTTDRGGTNEPERLPDRYSAVADDDGTLVVYDLENPDGWIRSDRSQPLTEMR